MGSTLILTDDIYGMILHTLQRPGRPIEVRLDEATRLLCKYRLLNVGQVLVEKGGDRVRTGPFAGMQFPQAAEGCFVPKLLGCYEQALHPIVAQFPASGYDSAVNIGCAEGYYAVGLARLLPEAAVYAFDIDPSALRLCRELADLNGFCGRINFGEEFTTASFAQFAGRRCLVLCDIEAAELDLLQPAAAPALAFMDVLVEVHDDLQPGCSQEIQNRFNSTHDITPILFSPSAHGAFLELAAFEQLDQLLAIWEWRLPGNHWLWMRSRELHP